ncbi:fumarylacetoacetate hydrolase family protein [Sphingobium subterraneum]|uniref:2-keto-4-pentenoate hydratase/2-oxohepta-3-ene-1,7-dioic acid hydratase in catechol pathway n=1 Tax=Sphingobium subterraneum TaxID=627688 RepID=A0A841J1H5_9SPHN|nr:fumarylacetoacetate hydrolase family protein [Sphingobium subterraneum]MBB6122388.1 2-keto-4-pentenoate hydratase/2-oxohepta-3-ene-1,7-dioic acid hydratase in catechol pathway [Sphingobium subterraneum]
MKLVTFRGPTGDGVGAIHSDGFVVDFAGIGAGFPTTMQNLIEAGDDALSQARQWVARAPAEARRSMDDIRLLAPLPRPIRLRDSMLFLEHLEVALAKLGIDMHPEFKRQTIYVNSDTAHIFGPGDDVPFPIDTDWIDYELEWACVIGKRGVAVKAEDARSHIFGYTVFNDWSARDLQTTFLQTGAGPGTGKDFGNSIGPCIATVDEFEDPYALKMSAHVNGELWSSGSTSTMFHKFEDAISNSSRIAPLTPGEIIGSGTVLNGCGFELDRKLSVGDEVRLEVEGIGVLSNRVTRLQEDM